MQHERRSHGVLKRGVGLYLHHFSADGMAELEGFGMEVEAVRWLSVEGIAYDGAAQAVGVGGVHTELVGAAGLGVVVEAGSTRVVMVVHCFYCILTTIGRKNLNAVRGCVQILRFAQDDKG